MTREKIWSETELNDLCQEIERTSVCWCYHAALYFRKIQLHSLSTISLSHNVFPLWANIRWKHWRLYCKAGFVEVTWGNTFWSVFLKIGIVIQRRSYRGRCTDGERCTRVGGQPFVFAMALFSRGLWAKSKPLCFFIPISSNRDGLKHL